MARRLLDVGLVRSRTHFFLSINAISGLDSVTSMEKLEAATAAALVMFPKLPLPIRFLKFRV